MNLEEKLLKNGFDVLLDDIFLFKKELNYQNRYNTSNRLGVNKLMITIRSTDYSATVTVRFGLIGTKYTIENPIPVVVRLLGLDILVIKKERKLLLNAIHLARNNKLEYFDGEIMAIHDTAAYSNIPRFVLMNTCRGSSLLSLLKFWYINFTQLEIVLGKVKEFLESLGKT